MQKTIVKGKNFSTPICTGVQLADIGRFLLSLKPPGFKKILVVTQPKIQKLYGKIVEKSLETSGSEVAFVLFPEGEETKNLATVEKLLQAALRHHLDRSSLIVALGGGVVGDVAGFVASIYLRGIACVQIPTTLLAMVDSAIGGKTGVDMAIAKNCVGAFHQPIAVWADTSVLATLPERERRNGLAEVIKYGVIADPVLFEKLEMQMQPGGNFSSDDLAKIIFRCAQIKADVVNRDEKETLGLRETLNFGHTLGHAIESATQYKVYKHGEAVALGMIAAGELALSKKMWAHKDQTRMIHLIARAGLPTTLTRKWPQTSIAKSLLHDKKVKEGALRFVLPKRIGKVVVEKITLDAAMNAYSKLFSKQ